MATATSPSPAPEQPSTPPAPRYGIWHDQWDPYQTRKSDRIASQRSKKTTPPPPSNSQSTAPRRSRNSQIAAGMSPQKKRQPAADSVRRASGQLTAHSTADAAAALGFQRPVAAAENPFGSFASLPTPKETPQKAPSSAEKKKLDSVSRNLFGGSQADSPIGARAKKSKKYSGLTIESFTAEPSDETFDIFTDSQDRIPNKDLRDSNPFYGETKPVTEPTKRRSPRRVMIPGEGLVSVEDACKREDGMVYNFRGRSYFRRKNEGNDESMDGEDNAQLETYVRRTEFKPRRLFTSGKETQVPDDEEAPTDIEDNDELAAQPAPQFGTPKPSETKRASTPDAPKHAPLSPPETRSTARFANKLGTGKLQQPDQRRVVDYFSSRGSRAREAGSPTKRVAESLTPDRPKRARNH